MEQAIRDLLSFYPVAAFALAAVGSAVVVLLAIILLAVVLGLSLRAVAVLARGVLGFPGVACAVGCLALALLGAYLVAPAWRGRSLDLPLSGPQGAGLAALAGSAVFGAAYSFRRWALWAFD